MSDGVIARQGYFICALWWTRMRTAMQLEVWDAKGAWAGVHRW